MGSSLSRIGVRLSGNRLPGVEGRESPSMKGGAGLPDPCLSSCGISCQVLTIPGRPAAGWITGMGRIAGVDDGSHMVTSEVSRYPSSPARRSAHSGSPDPEAACAASHRSMTASPRQSPMPRPMPLVVPSTAPPRRCKSLSNPDPRVRSEKPVQVTPWRLHRASNRIWLTARLRRTVLADCEQALACSRRPCRHLESTVHALASHPPGPAEASSSSV